MSEFAELTSTQSAILAVIFMGAWFGASAVISSYREKNRLRHIEKLIELLPNADREKFVREYLEDPKKVMEKLEEAAD